MEKQPSVKDINHIRIQLSIKTKNGLSFILAATVCWAFIALIWKIPAPPRLNAFRMFFAIAPMMPLARLFSKVLKTSWKVKGNPLRSLGLWLNLAQLFYFPFIFIAFYKHPEDMPMTFAIITGAHLFPFAWYYMARPYAVMAGIISVGAALVGSMVSESQFFLVPLYMTGTLLILAGLLYIDLRKKIKSGLYT